MKQGTDILIKVKSCNVYLQILLVSISIYQKSDLRYKFLILDTNHINTLYLCEKGCEEPWFFPNLTGICKQQSMGNNELMCIK
jgi:hypothetical protein